MKIAFLGNFVVDYSSETHHAIALEDLGHEVERIQEYATAANDIWARSRDADLFVWIHTHGWDTPRIEEVLREHKRRRLPMISYHLDLWTGLAREADLKSDIYFRQHYLDHFFTVDRAMAQRMNGTTRTKWHYLHPGVFHRECYAVDIPQIHDVIFVGQRHYHPEYPYREKLIGALEQRYGERFRLFPGDGPAVRGRDLNLLYGSTKVVVGDSLWLGSEHDHYWSDRVTETLGRGGFLIHPRLEALEEQFTDGKHLAYYERGNFEDLFAKIDEYLEVPLVRREIIETANSYVHTWHTYLQRWQQILETIGMWP